jgi:spoIIIJ-associated protein
MKEKRATLEVIAPSIEEAINKGLTELGLPKDAVEIEILDQGSHGLFGLGTRQARVRLRVKSVATMQEEPAGTNQSETASEEVVITSAESVPQAETTSIPTGRFKRDLETKEEEPFELMVARDTVNELLLKMKVHARVDARWGDTDEDQRRIPILVEVRGDDLSILIGRRAETLNALQYISSMIVNKELGKSVTLVIDVEGYRARREGQLRQLARRMAEQAVKTGRRQVLEPMPANERRIVHLELREYPEVTTESIGEEPRRKVTIIPKT